MKTFVVTFEITTPDNINEGMLSLKFDSENLERELYEHLDGEIDVDEEIIIDNIDIYEK